MTFSTLKPQACHARLQAGEALDVIDVRTPGEFGTLHAQPARLVPLDVLTPAAIDADRPVVLICKSGSRARQAAERLVAAGRRDVWVLEGGTDAWIAAGLPCVQGTSRVISLERQVRIAAGSLVAIGVSLSYLVHPGFIGLSLFVALGLIFAGITDNCGMAMLLARLPWNRASTHCHPNG